MTRDEVYEITREVVDVCLGDRAGDPVFDDPEDFDIAFDKAYRNVTRRIEIENDPKRLNTDDVKNYVSPLPKIRR